MAGGSLITVLGDMLKLVFFCLKVLFIPLAVMLLYAFAKTFLQEVTLQNSGFYHSLFRHPFLWALVAGVGLRFLMRFGPRRWGFSNPLDFLDTLEHELTHALFGYLTFSPPVSLLATLETGGEVKLKRSNVLVALSPYFFPLGAFLALGLGFLVKDSFLAWWHLLPFTLYGSFLYRVSTEFRWYQNDLKVYGFLFSTLFIGVFSVVSLAVILHVTGVLDWEWARGIGAELRLLLPWIGRILGVAV